MIILTKENFKETISSKDVTFVKFAVKKGCKACDNFKPQYENFEKRNPDNRLAIYERESLDTRAFPFDEIETEYNITSFPTVLAFKDGELQGKVETFSFLTDMELSSLILDREIMYAKIRKELFNLQQGTASMQDELNARIMKEKMEAPIKPVDTPIEIPVENKETKNPVDLSGFPPTQEDDCAGCA